MGGLFHLVQRGGNWAGCAHPSMASVPITVALCNGLLLCGFNVPIKGLKRTAVYSARHQINLHAQTKLSLSHCSICLYCTYSTLRSWNNCARTNTSLVSDDVFTQITLMSFDLWYCSDLRVLDANFNDLFTR